MKFAFAFVTLRTCASGKYFLIFNSLTYWIGIARGEKLC